MSATTGNQWTRLFGGWDGGSAWHQSYRVEAPAGTGTPATLNPQLGGKTLATGPWANPFTAGETHVVGADCDGANVIYYLDGKPFQTVAAYTTPSNNVNVGAGVAWAASTTTDSSYDWAGMLYHDAPLGASVHQQLATDAGVYVA